MFVFHEYSKRFHLEVTVSGQHNVLSTQGRCDCFLYIIVCITCVCTYAQTPWHLWSLSYCYVSSGDPTQADRLHRKPFYSASLEVLRSLTNCKLNGKLPTVYTWAYTPVTMVERCRKRRFAGRQGNWLWQRLPAVYGCQLPASSAL